MFFYNQGKHLTAVGSTLTGQHLDIWNSVVYEIENDEVSVETL